jgi:hypothetical protein
LEDHGGLTDCSNGTTTLRHRCSPPTNSGKDP